MRFNYQVVVARQEVTRNQRQTIARKLRSIFTEIQLHGDKRASNDVADSGGD